MINCRLNRLWIIFIGLILTVITFAQDVSFVVGADNRNYYQQFRLVLEEVNDMTFNPAPQIPYPSFFLACGDFDPVADNMAIYNDTSAYPNLPPFFPVVGNHEFETPSDMNYILNSMIPSLPNVVNNGAQGTYSFDYNNVHFVVLDQYSMNSEGEVDPDLQVWLQHDLNNTDKDHVFVFGHEPAYPRYRHLSDALNQFPDSRDAFWEILMIDPRIRAYFCGHTHYYYRMRVADPNSAGTTGFPNQPNGVYQIDAGAMGHELSDGFMTLVYVHVEEDSVRFRTITSLRDTIEWGVTDHWSITNLSRFAMQLIEPQTGDEVSGNTDIIWNYFNEIHTILNTKIYVSRDNGAHWDSLWADQTQDTIYNWNTLNHPDGTRYSLLVVSKDDSGFGLSRTSGTFTINNPGNALPEIELISPAGGEIISGDFLVKWNAADADGDVLLFSLDMTTNDGITWQPLMVDQPNDSVFLWNTSIFQNSSLFQLRLRCSDNLVEVADTSGIFEVFNEHPTISDTLIKHISGNSNAIVKALIANPDSVKEGNFYRITFDDTLFNYKTYNVQNLSTGNMMIQNAGQLDGVTEGPMFDGMRLVIKDFDPAIINLDSSRWVIGNSTLELTIYLPQIDLGAGNILKGYPYPADYKINIFDQIVDTSSTAWGAPDIPMKFTVYNNTENHAAEIIFLDNDGNNTISRLDEVYILETDSIGDPLLTWGISFGGLPTAIDPLPGDEYEFRALKPLTLNDVYEFSPIVFIGKDNLINIPEKITLYQNYPNPFNSTTTIRYSLPQKSKVILKIFDILGQEVETLINKVQKAGRKTIVWDGKNRAGQQVSSGVYLYFLKAGNYTITRKMLILK